MHTFLYVGGLLVTAASVAAANPPAQSAQAHGNPHKTATMTTGAPAATTTTTPPALNPIAARISTHPSLEERIKPILQGTGMTLDQASRGFKNQGQFISALHASKNLDIPFKDLRTQMVTDNRSLGQSIQALKKTADASTAVRAAERQADVDVKKTTTSSSTTRKINPRPKTQ
jgi:hypothetical protein